MKSILGWAFGIVAASTPAHGWAFAPPAHLDDARTLIVQSGEAARIQRAVTWTVPSAQRTNFERFEALEGNGWRAYFDAHTKVPGRIFGPGIAHPGSSADPVRAEAAARAVLTRHLALFAPGASLSDFELVSNHFDAKTQLRTVAFEQSHRGLEVRGGAVSFRIKNDRVFVIGSEALPSVDVVLPSSVVPAREAKKLAERWIAADANGVAVRGEVSSAFVLPIISDSGNIRYPVVIEVVVDAASPLGRWSVFLDAQTGKAVAKTQTLRFASGTVSLDAPERHPGSTRAIFGADRIDLTLNGQTVTTDQMGNVSWTGTAPAQFTLRLRGPEVVVSNSGAAGATHSFTLNDGGTYTWDMRGEELADAQITTFVASGQVKEYMKQLAPGLQWLFRDPVDATVNINDSCNAFSDGTAINFFRSSNRCENTGRLTDVVHHEFGHSVHAHAIIRGAGAMDGALGEGVSDYLSATMSNDPGMGRGFFRSNQPLRHLDLADEATWPADIGEIHETGIIIGGALWDLRKAMITAHGMAQGVEATDQIWYSIIQRASDIPASYAEALAADDDDGDLSNGTPNVCLINDAFARHGLADPEVSGPPIGRHQITRLHVELPVDTAGTACPGSTLSRVELDWRLRAQPSTGGTLTLSPSALGYATDIPEQPANTVVEYRFRVTLDGGDVIALPNNAADPYYEQYVGETVQLYCTDFESDPDGEGWAHELVAGEQREGADDWQWGEPTSVAGSGDPGRAFSGTRVYGNDLGGGNYNGKYQPDKTNALHSPAIDTMGYSVVRLQYRRWLTIEDGDFDRGTILGNGRPAWSNRATGGNGNTHHEDREWRFHDVDLSSFVANGVLQVSFELKSDGGLEFGGWTVDDFCLVGYEPPVNAICGNGALEAGEVCDDGNKINGDGCEADCTTSPVVEPRCGDGKVDPGEVCDDGNAVDGDGCQLDCSLTPGVVVPMCPGDPSCPVTPDPTNPGLEQGSVGGCGCASTESESPASALLLGLAVLGLGLCRRRRSR